MIKIKVIELLVKIANGEEVPLKINYEGLDYTYDEGLGDYKSGIETNLFETLFEGTKTKFFINDEVEIIEEDKKIRKLDFIEENTFSKRQNGMTSEDRRLLDSNFKEIGNKINEIIDKINKE